MRIYTTPRTTANYYDRAPLHKSASGGTFNTAPHAQTTRWSYTVPAGRKFALEAWQLNEYRMAAAAPIGQWIVTIEVSPLGAGFVNIQQIETEKNAVGDQVIQNLAGTIYLLASDVLRGTDSDLSTGGTTTQNSIFRGTEFDA